MTEAKVRVVIVSTHRADRGHYAPLLRLLEADGRFKVIVTPNEKVQTVCAADVAVVLGDRYEMLQQAMAWVEHRVPLLHIHGGEHTYGSLDERWRYAISAIADAHCVATAEAYDELKRLGYEHVTVVGAPGLDGITENRNGRWGEVLRPFVLIHYNPVMDAETTTKEADAIRLAMARNVAYYGWVEPNGDRFSECIRIPSRDGGLAPCNRIETLEPDAYRDLLSIADVLVGNTSAGIIEAPSFGLPFVNVGDRQKGRLRGANVIDVETDPQKIGWAIERAILEPRPPKKNPYGDGHASERIRDVLLTMAGPKATRTCTNWVGVSVGRGLVCANCGVREAGHRFPDEGIHGDLPDWNK